MPVTDTVQTGLITGTVTKTSHSFVSPNANHDYSLVGKAISRQAGFPGQFEL